MAPWSSFSACHGCSQNLFSPISPMPKHAFVPASLGELSVVCSPGVAWAPELLGSRCVVDEVGLPVKQKKSFLLIFQCFPPQGARVGCPCTRFGCGELCSVAQGLQIPQPEMGGRVKNGVRNAHPEGKQMHLWWLCSLRGCGTSDARVDCPVKVEKGRESFQFPAGCRERRGESRALPLTLLRESG